MTSDRRKKQQLGSVAGIAGGGYAGLKAVNGVKRAGQGAVGAKAGYKLQRGLLQGTKKEAFVSGAKTAVAGAKARPRGFGLKAMGAYTGAAIGLTVADIKTGKLPAKKKVKKSDTVSAFGIDHG